MGRPDSYNIYVEVAGIYDHITEYIERQDVDFYVDAAREAQGPVLEVGCGTGRVLIPTAREGFEITGLDLSPHMLDVCRARLAEEPQEVQERVRLLHADMRDFDLGRIFSLITVPFRPFQHLTTVEDQMACLRAISRHLAPDSKLILDLFNPSLDFLTRDNVGQEENLSHEDLLLPDGRKMRRSDRIVSRDYFAQVQEVELIYYLTHPDGKQERIVFAFPMRWLYRFEAEHLLVRCGYEVEALYGDYDKSAYGQAPYPGELIFVAKKAS